MTTLLRVFVPTLATLLGACASTATTPIQAPVQQETVATQQANETQSSDPDPKQAAKAPTRLTGNATKTADINNTLLAEISGITAASASDLAFWAINDSGNSSTLFAINHSGEAIGQHALPTRNRDWESLSRTTIAGQPYLIVGETGDNLRHHINYKLHFIPEPKSHAKPQGSITRFHTMTFEFPRADPLDARTSNHNVEAMAATGNTVFLITKEPLLNGKPVAATLFSLELNPSSGDNKQMATYIGKMQVRPSSLASKLAASLANVDLDQATALSFSPDQTAAYVLTYRHVVRYTKNADQRWQDVLLGPGKVIHTHGLRQAEAMTIDNSGVLWITSEKLPAPIWAIPTYKQFE